MAALPRSPTSPGCAALAVRRLPYRPICPVQPELVVEPCEFLHVFCLEVHRIDGVVVIVTMCLIKSFLLGLHHQHVLPIARKPERSELSSGAAMEGTTGRSVKHCQECRLRGQSRFPTSNIHREHAAVLANIDWQLIMSQHDQSPGIRGPQDLVGLPHHP